MLYAGYLYESEVAHYWLQFRVYDPHTGRFLTIDPIGVWGDTANWGNGYGYGGANPLSGYDFMGLGWLADLAGGLIDGAISGATFGLMETTIGAQLTGADTSSLTYQAGSAVGNVVGGVAVSAATGGAGGALGVAVKGAQALGKVKDVVDGATAAVEAGTAVANGESITGAVTGVVVSATVGVVAGKALGKARGRGNSDADGEAPRDASDKPAPPPTTSPEPAKVDKVAPSDPPSANVDAGDAGGGPMCFPAGTLVATPAGDVSIEEIAAGCVVYGYDVETGQVVEREVVRTFENVTSSWVDIELDGEIVTATPEHPIWVQSERDWVPAANLRPGVTLLSQSDKLQVVRDVRTRELQVPERTFNFEVRGVHDYFVGRLAVLVHNECDDAPNRTLNDPLPANPKKPTQADPHAPLPEAEGVPHTVVGTRTDPKRSPEPYRQGITYDKDGNPVGRTDVTNHGRGDHDNPHWHPWDPDQHNPFDPDNPGNFGTAQPMPRD
ncbi:MAG: polymorphic toxin-type HINT domain-containing protein [Planctomycetota bacterium]